MGGHHNQQVTLARCYENRAPKQAFTGTGFCWFKKRKPFLKFLQGGFLATAKSLIHPPKLLLQYHEHGYQRKSLDLCGPDESRRRIAVMARSEKKWKHQYALPGKGWLWGSSASKESFRSFFYLRQCWICSPDASWHLWPHQYSHRLRLFFVKRSEGEDLWKVWAEIKTWRWPKKKEGEDVNPLKTLHTFLSASSQGMRDK